MEAIAKDKNLRAEKNDEMERYKDSLNAARIFLENKKKLENERLSSSQKETQPALYEKFILRFVIIRILRAFYGIELTSPEEEIADSAIVQKYVPAISRALFFSLLLIPALLFLNTEIVISVLIPATMVAGTAWFAVSLASMKKKFEGFGMELTKDLFVAFSLSLAMLLLATIMSLTTSLWKPLIPIKLMENIFIISVSATLAIFVVGKLLFSIFAGSLKYDINDAMLTGQNEVAERFFKQSLSLLFITAQQLQRGMELQVANYYLGLCFYEVFNNILELKTMAREPVDKLISQANKLIKGPSMSQQDADDIVINLIRSFVGLCSKDKDVQKNRSYLAIEFELDCLKDNKESREMVDIRMSVVLSEISNLIEMFGPRLFDTV